MERFIDAAQDEDEAFAFEQKQDQAKRSALLARSKTITQSPSKKKYERADLLNDA
jgi:hypothetical protein